jgi:hypothetical protein
MADVALGEIRLVGLDGPKDAGSDACPYSYASQFRACFVRLLMIAGLKEELSSGSRDLSTGEYRGLKGGSNSPQSGPYTTPGKDIRRTNDRKSGHEKKARFRA